MADNLDFNGADSQDAAFDLIPANTQDCGTQEFLGVSIHQDFHHSSGLILLLGAVDHCHWSGRHQNPASGIFGFFLTHSHPA